MDLEEAERVVGLNLQEHGKGEGLLAVCKVFYKYGDEESVRRIIAKMPEHFRAYKLPCFLHKFQ